jgi:chromatin segregation and condensation protein Rec8/ScpA/Scc1 (kleisin family)
LEMVREGTIDVQQHKAFAPLYVRKRVANKPDKPGPAAPGATKQ